MSLISEPKLIDFEDVRGDLHEEAVAIIKSALARSAASLSPTLIHLCGIPGAGKTTYASKWMKGSNQQTLFACLQFDTVMEKLSGYQRDKARLGLVEAFRLWELPARAVGYQLLQALIDNKRNVLFDHSATNRSHIDLIAAVKDRGYSVEMHYIQCTPADAAIRVRQREALIERHTPEHFIYERHESLQELLPVYRHLVDKFIDVSFEETSGWITSVLAGQPATTNY